MLGTIAFIILMVMLLGAVAMGMIYWLIVTDDHH